MSKRYIVPVAVEELDEGGYLATCEVIPGCLSEGASIGEAIENLEDVARVLLETLIEDGAGLPPGLEKASAGALELRAQILLPVE